MLSLVSRQLLTQAFTSSTMCLHACYFDSFLRQLHYLHTSHAFRPPRVRNVGDCIGCGALQPGAADFSTLGAAKATLFESERCAADVKATVIQCHSH